MLTKQPIRKMAEGLIAAAKNGNFDSVFTLLQQGCSVEAHDKDNATPLYWSACHGYAPLCEVLIQAGSDVNARVKWGSTALHAAADRGHLSCVAVLTQSGANVNSQNSRGDTPLHIAAYRGFTDITKALLKTGTDITVRNEKGKTPDEEAIEGGHKNVAACIKRHNTEDKCRRSPTSRPQLSPPLSYNITNDLSSPVVVSLAKSSGSSSSLCSTATSGSCSSSGGSSMDPELKGSRNDIGSHRYDDSADRDHARFSQTPLCRSMSVEAPDVSKISRLQHLAPPGQLPYRTSSVGSIALASSGRNSGYNDVNRTYSSNECINWPPSPDMSAVTNNAPTCVEAISCSDDVLRRPPKLTSLTSNGRCVVATSTEYSSSPNIGNDEGHGIQNIHATLRQFNAANRPNRSSIGSIREISGYHESQDDFVKTLQTQLVESYRHAEKLTKENENLRFKCSTLLNRLTEEERQHEDMKREHDNLRGLVEAYRAELEQRDAIIRKLKGGHATARGQEERWENRAGQQDEDYSMQTLEDLQAKLRNLHRPPMPVVKPLDAAHKEWLPNDDYVILDDTPICSQSDGQLTESISFQIKHKKTDKEMILKKPYNLTKRLYISGQLLLNYTSRTEPKCDVAPATSLDVPCLFGKQQDFRTVPVHHHYIGRTAYFKKFVSIPKSLSNSVKLADWTAFVVTPRLLTLNVIMTSHRNNSFPLNVTFVSQVMYQLTSSLCVIEEHGCSHGNINIDTILFDAEMRAVFDNSWVKVNCNGINGQPRGDSNVQSNSCMDVCGLFNGRNGERRWRRPQVPFPRLEANTDLVCLLQLFDTLLTSTNGIVSSQAILVNGTKGMTSDITSDITSSPGAHTNGTTPDANDEDVLFLAELRQFVLNSLSGNRLSTCSVWDVRNRLGCFLFGPRKGTVNNVQDCRHYIRSSIENRLSQHSQAASLPAASGNRAYMDTLIRKQTDELSSDFWCSITPEALLEACRYLER